MLSRLNRRSDHYGRTRENRLRLPSMVMSRVAEAVGDFPVGVRLDADESIRRGYSVDDAGVIAVRLASLGAAYVSLSAGGKFEDAVVRDGEPLYPYTGYSGDRAMPGDYYPDAINIWMARAVRTAVRAAGHNTPILGAGKIGTAALASELIADGACDIVGMARATLADPYLPAKSAAGRPEDVIRCIYCNVCKSLDESFKTVVCYLWPKGATQAPTPDEAPADVADWPGDNLLVAVVGPGDVRLAWPALAGAAGYDVLRSDNGGDYASFTACTRARQLDDTVVAGVDYRYRVIPYDSAGRRGAPSNTVSATVAPFNHQKRDS